MVPAGEADTAPAVVSKCPPTAPSGFSRTSFSAGGDAAPSMVDQYNVTSTSAPPGSTRNKLGSSSVVSQPSPRNVLMLTASRRPDGPGGTDNRTAGNPAPRSVGPGINDRLKVPGSRRMRRLDTPRPVVCDWSSGAGIVGLVPYGGAVMVAFLAVRRCQTIPVQLACAPCWYHSNMPPRGGIVEYLLDRVTVHRVSTSKTGHGRWTDGNRAHDRPLTPSTTDTID